jgi:ABC-type amino acid transport substrate-binding protein
LTGAWGVLAPYELRPVAQTPAIPPVRGRRAEEIQQRGVLRFGFTDDEVPWAFRNGRGELVGLEIDLMHALAAELGLKLEFLPVARADREQALRLGICDVAAGRVRPSGQMLFSRPITDEAWAFIVPDHERAVFASLERARQHPGLRVAVLRNPEWVQRLEALLPDAEVAPVDSLLDFVTAPPGRFDAMYTGFARGTAMSLLHPQFTTVIPAPGLGAVPIAFSVPDGEAALLARLDAWVEQERASGLIEAKVDYWVRGKGARVEQGARWSVAKDLLGWWKG